MKKKLLALAAVLALAVGSVGCGKSDDSNKNSSNDNASSGNKTVVVAMGGGFTDLDPGYVYEMYPPLVVNACYETLYTFNGDHDEPEPSLATGAEFSEDGLTCTLQLREDAVFASGNKVTSEDVAFSLNRTKNLQGNPAFICDTIESIECPDEHTVVLHLNTPDSGLLSKLTYAACSVLDSKVVKENGGTDAENAVTEDKALKYLNSTSAGSGMYVMTSYTPDEEIVLEKNKNYYGDSTNIEKYIIKIQDDANAQMMGLSSGDIDIALNLTDDTMAELKDNDSVEVLNTPTKTVGFVMMNCDKEIGGPVADTKVQQAIKYALDYEGIQTICGSGTTTPKSIIQVGFMGTAGGVDAKSARDLDKAKELLKEAGYEKGFDIQMQVCELDMEGISLLDLAQKIQSDLKEVGIEVKIEQVNWAAGYGDSYRDGKLGFTVMYWGIDYNDPNVQLEFLPGASVGLRAGWKADGNEELAAMKEKIEKATENDARTALLEEMQEKMEENCPFIMIAQAPSHFGYSANLDGVVSSDPYRLDLRLINRK